MIWIFLTIVAVGLVAVFGALLTGWIGADPMAEVTHTQPDPGLPEAPRASDVAVVRFDTAVRGYRMDQVDVVLDRLQAQLAAQERELDRLRGG
jgi:DivIVA domain-containing protein